MKPPLTTSATTKNDVVVQQPTIHNNHRKIQQIVNQKEILTENQINQQQQQQQQQQQNQNLSIRNNDEITTTSNNLENYKKLPINDKIPKNNTTTITKLKISSSSSSDNNCKSLLPSSTEQNLIISKLLTNNQQTNQEITNNFNSFLNSSLDSSSSNSDSISSLSLSKNLIADVPIKNNIILSNNFEYFDSTDDQLLYFSYPTENYLIDNNQSTSTKLKSSTISNGIDNLINNIIVPLSSDDKEPLLLKNNIDTTNITTKTTTTINNISDPKNSICLNKNSASLIFTKKDLSLLQFDKSYNNNKLNNNQLNINNNNNLINNCNNKNINLKHQQQQQQQNRYCRRRSSGAFSGNISNNKINNSYKIEPIRRNSTIIENINKNDNISSNNSLLLNIDDIKQENRRSLQLNYYSTIKSDVIEGNCDIEGSSTIITTTSSSSAAAAPIPITTTTNNKDNLIGQQRINSTITTASNRKQLAYSWYAPVYSALEEEIEQDSKDTSPIHNLANIKKKNHHQIDDNETLSLLENNKNQINIQPQLHQPRVKRQVICSSLPSPQPPPSTLQLPPQSSSTLNQNNLTTITVSQQQQQQQNQTQQQQQLNDNEGPHATSLLAGGPLPRRRRFENFLKSLVGRKPSKEQIIQINNNNNNNNQIVSNITNQKNYIVTNNNNNNNNIQSYPNLPSPEITITHSPSENSLYREISRISCTSSDNYDSGSRSGCSLHINDDPGYQNHHNQQQQQQQKQQQQITNSTLSLNTVQQKILNVVPTILRREGSVSSLYNEKSQSIVQYTGLRKCETVLALSRQSSTYSAICGNTNCNNRNRNNNNNNNNNCCGSGNCNSNNGGNNSIQIDGHKNINGRNSSSSSSNGGSNEPIKPLNRLRNSISTMNTTTTCSRCSSLLSLAASGSRYSLNIANSGFVTVNNNNNCNAIRKTSANAILGFVNNNNNNNNNNDLHSPLTPPVNNIIDSPITTQLIPTVNELENDDDDDVEMFICKLCLTDVESTSESTIIEQCGCKFCTECMKAYVEFEISEGAYDISCPDAQCPAQGILNILEITLLSSQILMKKHHQYRLNREIELDKTRTWCPKAGCETICLIGSPIPHQQQQPQTISSPSSTSSPTAITSVTTVTPSLDDKGATITSTTAIIHCSVQCPTCREEFCSGCKKAWHPNITCDEFSRQDDTIGIPFDNDLIKCCPMCAVPIEKDEGCAQMMCKRCKHVFCWYCLASLDDDFLLRHYDKGPCKNKLGHSRASVVWHRAQVIGIFAGFGILLLVASPLLLLAAPCIICCKCRICSGAAKIDDPDTDFDEGVALQR